MSTESTKNSNGIEELKKSLETTNEFYMAGVDNDIQYDDKYKNIIELLKKLLNEDKYKNNTEVNEEDKQIIEKVKKIINRLINGFFKKEISTISDENLQSEDFKKAIDSYEEMINALNEGLNNSQILNLENINKLLSNFDEEKKLVKNTINTLELSIRISFLYRIHFDHMIKALISAKSSEGKDEVIKNLTKEFTTGISNLSKLLVSNNLEPNQTIVSNKYKLFNNNNNNYLSKYMKYKNKYLSLKNNNYF